MSGLTDAQKKKAYKEIMPVPINVHEETGGSLGEFLSLSSMDFGRGMLNHQKYCLYESLDSFESIVKTEKVEPSDIDNIILTTSLKAFSLSKKEANKGDILYSIPSFSYGFPLLLSYHLILQHVVGSLSSEIGVRFNKNSGILILTDNIELLSHIWRTSIDNTFLRDYIKIYTVEAEKFKTFTFNENKSKKKKNKINNNDGTLPWLALFRAYRHSLPENLDMEPDVIVIDLLPFRHRARAMNLVKWAKKHAKHVIIIAPARDEISLNIAAELDNCIPVDMYTIESFENLFNINIDSVSNPVTAAWSIQSSIPYLKQGEREITIQQIKGLRSLNQSFNRALAILDKSYTESGKQVLSFKKVQNVLLKMLSIPIPLEWYERTRWSQGKPTIKEILLTVSKIQSDGYEEKIIVDTLMPHLLKDVIEIYDILLEMGDSPRGKVIKELLNTYMDNKDNILIIVSDKLVAEELKVWLRATLNVTLNDLIKVNVMTQENWAKKQLKEIYLDELNEPDFVILVNPWNKKYLSSSYFSKRTEVHIIEGFKELPLIKYQINKMTSNLYPQRLNTTFSNFFGANIDASNKKGTVPLVKINFNNHIINFADTRVISDISNKTEIDYLFKDDVLIKILTEENDFDEEWGLNSNIADKSYLDNLFVDNFSDTYFTCVKVSVSIGLKQDKDNDNYVFIPNDSTVKVKKFNEPDVKTINPLEMKSGDIWVRIKKQQRKELFNTILSMSSNALIMKWIEANANEWKDMLNLLWYKFHHGSTYKSESYEKILNAINNNGGKIISPLTISNWINGDVSLVRDYANVRAIARVLGEKQYEDRVQSIYKAMRELWGIHIKLGKALGKIVTEQATGLVEGYELDESRWIDLGKGMRISMKDVLDILEFSEIKRLDINQEYLVHPSIVEKIISGETKNLFIERGLVRYGETAEDQ
ncbi:hypothetical protein COK40_04825 [Bacillus cereus]|uniref:DrmE family protein n=1 Tax=Bacillus cereus TaxID=1396 RepID=UPI000BF2AD8F|nr:DrmE family protein [Bacillus cereus]PFR78042.1 hypothetical protein COK40_04825 [Bacillus cereus]